MAPVAAETARRPRAASPAPRKSSEGPGHAGAADENTPPPAAAAAEQHADEIVKAAKVPKAANTEATAGDAKAAVVPAQSGLRGALAASWARACSAPKVIASVSGKPLAWAAAALKGLAACPRRLLARRSGGSAEEKTAGKTD